MAERLHLSESQPSSTLVIGPVGFDTIITPMQEGDLALGGSATYASLASSYFAPTRLETIVGDDFGKSHVDRFNDRGIDTSGFKWGQGRSFYWKGRYFEDFAKRETLRIDLNVFNDFDPKLSHEYANTPYVFIGSFDPDLQLNALNSLQGNPFIVVDVIDHWIKTKRDTFLKVMNAVDLLVINESEACVLAQVGSLIDAGHTLRELGATTVVIKKGQHGSVMFHEEGLFASPSFPTRTIQDPTGTGDTFAGGLIGYLAAVNKPDFFNLKHAVIYATIMASIVIEGISCSKLEGLTCKAIEERYEALLNMMTF